MMSKRKKNEGGFTLIELIMVIVILGIISAVAIPKFLSLSDSAKLSAARGVGGGISGTISSEHSDYLMNGNTYAMADILSNTAFAGGITYVSGTGPAAAGQIRDNGNGEVELDFKNETFQWTYNALGASGEPAYIIEKAGNFPQ